MCVTVCLCMCMHECVLRVCCVCMSCVYVPLCVSMYAYVCHVTVCAFACACMSVWVCVCVCVCVRICAVLMIMADHQTFSSRFKHLTSQAKFSQTNFLYIINEKVVFNRKTGVQTIFNPYHKHYVCHYVSCMCMHEYVCFVSTVCVCVCVCMCVCVHRHRNQRAMAPQKF